MSTINNFTFVVITYNHEKYILDHLESIKYLIENFGGGIDIDIIIADDASQDDTVQISRSWCDKNYFLFKKVEILSDGVNKGTCKNLTTALNLLATEYCKITAGDDVYSYENLFFECEKVDGNHIISGFPLNLINDTLMSTRFDLFNLYATNIIYEKCQYLTRLKRINFFNSPSIVYAVSALRNKEITDFVGQYSVTEDYPLQIRMAELFRPLKFVQIEKIFVYYRRTLNSTYMIKNTAFSQDKTELFNYLIKYERNIFGKLLLKNRLFCFRLNNKYFKRALNLSCYLYGFGILKNIFRILDEVEKFDTQLDKHQTHYDLILTRSKRFDISSI